MKRKNYALRACHDLPKRALKYNIIHQALDGCHHAIHYLQTHSLTEREYELLLSELRLIIAKAS